MRSSAPQAKAVVRVGPRPSTASRTLRPAASPTLLGRAIETLRGGPARVARERSWSAVVGRRPTAPRVVTFVAGKGGVGTTSAAAGLALTIAAFWPGEVALADARNGTASLGLRIGGVPAPDATAFAAGVVEPLRVAGVTIVDGASWDTPLTRPTLARLVADLREEHVFTVLDVGDDAGDTGHGALARADRVVVVTTPAPDAVAAAERTLDRLSGIDPSRARGAVVVITGARGLGRAVGRRPAVPPNAANVVRLPWDRGLDGGMGLDLDRLRRATRAAYLELAAAIGDEP